MAKRANNLNISIFSALKASEVSKVPVLLLSNPGIGKTTTVYMFAKLRGYEVVELRGNSTTAEEVNGYDVAPKDVVFDVPQAACHLRPSWFEEVLRNHEKGLKTLLFLDEITTANEFVQSALLKLIFDRACGREMLPEDTLIVSAGNYSQNLAATMFLLPPVMNRFMIYNVIPSVSDVDIFLNKFKGSAISKKENYYDEIMKVLSEMDANQRIVNDNIYDKMGELFENAIRHTSHQIVSGEKGINLAITDLQGIYNNLSTDPRVYGFISFRTLGYLRDIALTWYLCFGKEGINSEDFRNAVDGLCGVGLKYTTIGRNTDRRGGSTEVEVTTVHVGEDFHNSLRQAANDCEKLGNLTFEEYAEYFRMWINRTKNWKKDENFAIIPEINAAINKISELNTVKELSDIERPIEEAVLIDIMDTVSSSASSKMNTVKSSIVKDYSSDDEKSSSLSPDRLIGFINEINKVTELFNKINVLVSDDARGYHDNVLEAFGKAYRNVLTPTVAQLKLIIKMAKQRKPEMSDLFPQLVTVDGKA